MERTITIMYIHGYGSNGNATKGQLLRKMTPQCRVVSPTFDYDHSTPWQIQEQIRETVESEQVKMIVGSSFGGYHSLCATAFFHGPVWAINPVHDVAKTIKRVIVKDNQSKDEGEAFLGKYVRFDEESFQRQSVLNRSEEWPKECSLNFALSTDDELLGDHKPLLELFPLHDKVEWMDQSGHHFLRFEELAASIADTVQSIIR